ncbi:MAG TPA: hypothetical protein VL117_09260 [Thermoleophilia bacterium]|nr:hypothetical protein [Thermoleophilia bacterium]
MPGGVDEYLSDLHDQLARCAAAESARARRRDAGAVPASARFGRRPAPRRLLAWAAVLVVGVGALAAGLVVAGYHSATPAAPGALLATPGRSLPAYVQPVIPVVSPSNAGVAGAAQPSYSLAAIAAVSDNDVWSVGAHGDAASGAVSGASAVESHSFVLHYDGASWRETTVPDVGPLTAVGATSDGEAWALGPAGAIVHWDGRQWRTVLTAARDGGAVLRGLAALAPDDVWAVGSLQGAPFAVHWDGGAWRTAALPALPGAGSLNAVSGTATSLWAVGVGADAAHVLTLRYDGTSWTPVADAGVSDGGLLTVAVVAPDDVWAAGDALLQHFDGTQWRDVSQTFSGVREALAAPAPTSVWLAGAAGVAAYDGDDWSPVSPQALDVYKLTDPQFGAASAVSPTDVWIAGSLGGSGAPSAPLIVHYDGTAWRLAVDAVRSR